MSDGREGGASDAPDVSSSAADSGAPDASSPTPSDAPAGGSAARPRQRVERASGGSRRARLTPAPGTDPSPEAAVPGAHEPDAPAKRVRGTSADDDRITRERPPHW
ncbi:hypothetical protein [Agromyces protaetiae]|uniref:hypothetical protein n=1 Tax=Agromyces protaetiae TaxID=2509455 RepID=UPI001FB82774|nr:hypothetical protein [Agromyces protaetiae]